MKTQQPEREEQIVDEPNHSSADCGQAADVRVLEEEHLGRAVRCGPRELATIGGNAIARRVVFSSTNTPRGREQRGEMPIAEQEARKLTAALRLIVGRVGKDDIEQLVRPGALQKRETLPGLRTCAAQFRADEVLLDRAHGGAVFLHKQCRDCSPRLSASMPSAPVPANKSSTRAPIDPLAKAREDGGLHAVHRWPHRSVRHRRVECRRQSRRSLSWRRSRLRRGLRRESVGRSSHRRRCVPPSEELLAGGGAAVELPAASSFFLLLRPIRFVAAEKAADQPLQIAQFGRRQACPSDRSSVSRPCQ